MIYRKFESQDIASIRDILCKDLGYDIKLNELSNRVEEMMKRSNYQIFVACDGNKVVGFIGCVSYLAFELENEGMKIIALAVSKKYRRKGIGTVLLKYAEKQAKENNIEVRLRFSLIDLIMAAAGIAFLTISMTAIKKICHNRKVKREAEKLAKQKAE